MTAGTASTASTNTTTDTEAITVDAKTQRLLNALGYAPADLAANRKGRLSKKQRQKYAPPKISPLVQTVIWGHMAVVGGILGAIAVISGEMILLLVMGIVAGLGALPFMMMQNEGALRPVVSADVAKGDVAQACGTVFLERESRKNRGVNYYLMIKEHKLRITSKVYSALTPNADYCVYYMPYSKEFIAAETLTDEA